MIRTVRQEDFQEAYGILCSRILPMPGTSMPFGSTWCQIPAGGSTSPHDHFDGEVFIVLKGKGRMEISGEESNAVGVGDIIFIRPHRNHVLHNRSLSEPLEFLSVFWDHASELFQSALPDHSLIIAAPPTPNGDLHVGHLSGPYLAADIYRRYLKLRGRSTHFLCGSDDHQSYVPTKAKQLSSTSTEVVDRFAAAIQQTLSMADIRTDRFVRPMHDPEYIRYVQRFFQKLVDKGAIEYTPSPVLYCVTCKMQVFEAHVRGTCPHCAATTNGHGCEQCGLLNDAHDLKSPQCNHCGGVPECRQQLRHRFALETQREFLSQYHKTLKMNDRLQALSHRLLQQALPVVSASFQADWGIPVPGDNPDGLVIYEWLEMAAGYRYIGEKLKNETDRNPFTPDPLSEIVLFFGFDNSFFYSTFIPAVLHAYEPVASLPRALVTNEFYRLEGLKFSTSRNHAIWGRDLLKNVPADPVRLHLSLDRPENEQSNFELSALRDSIATKLIDGVEKWIQALDQALGSTDRVVPKYFAANSAQRTHHARVRQLVDEIDRYYRADHFSPRNVTQRLFSIVDETKAFSLKNAFHREHNRAMYESGVALELASLRALAFSAAPIMPTWSEKLLRRLEVPSAWDADVNPPAAGKVLSSLPTNEFSKALTAVDGFIDGRK